MLKTSLTELYFFWSKKFSFYHGFGRIIVRRLGDQTTLLQTEIKAITETLNRFKKP